MSIQTLCELAVRGFRIPLMLSCVLAAFAICSQVRSENPQPAADKAGKGTRSQNGGSHSGRKEMVLVFDQMSRVSGELQLLLAPSAVRIDDKRNKVSVICRTADWRVFVFSNRHKHLYSTALKNWSGGNVQGLAAFIGPSWDSYQWKRSGKGAVKYAGLDATLYLQGALLPDEEKASKSRTFVQGKYLAFDNEGVAPGVISFLRKFYSVPKIGGIPLSLSYKRNAEDTNNQNLETKKFSTQLMDTAVFNVPTGYKQVKTETEVIADDSVQGLMKEITGF